MPKKVFIPAILFLIISITGIILLLNYKKTTSLQTALVKEEQAASSVIFFYGDGCPHCTLVEKFVAENGIEAKVPFTQKEVYYNKQNASELAEKAKICGMPTDSIGVPFLWDGSKCIVGDQPIIDFFKQKVNTQ